jgi:hypothetical protein
MRPENEAHRETSITSDETYHSSPSAEGTTTTKYAEAAANHPALKSIQATFEPGSPTLSQSDGSSEVEDLAHVTLTEQMKHLSIANLEQRFFGQSR